MHIINILEQIVENIKEESNILNIVDNDDNTYTIQTNNLKSLQIKDFIKILGNPDFQDYYEISKIDNLQNNITIKSAKGKNISDFTKWKAAKPYFIYEKWMGVSNEILLNHITNKYTKQNYPLIFLLLDIYEKRESNISNILTEAEIRIFFINNTLSDVNSKYRLENNIKINLIPIYENFLNELKSNTYIIKNPFQNIEHTYVERFFLGNETKNQNKINDYVDCIECNFKLNFRKIFEC